MKPTLDLSSLTADYDVVGELDDAADARSYIATRKGESSKRRSDQTGVLVTVVSTPEGDESNALSQLAADTQTLARTTHRRLVPVIEGRWLGDDAFAVVTQRVMDPTLSQRLATGETFANTRVAAILREVNGLLEWARAQKIVHRGIPASRIYLEPRTDRVRVSFAIAPIKRLHRSDEHDDARTIARLAMAMLTGDVDPHAYEGETLAQLRPDLPERLGEATAALLDEKNAATVPDVAAYLALIGMADPLAAGEAERERIRAEILEEQRAEREKLASERAAFEAMMAEERAAFERTMADERAARERAETLERERVEKERLDLQAAATREREELQVAVSAERSALVARRAELERVVAEQRAELERVAARDRESIEALREEIRRAGEHEVEQKRQTALDEISDAEDTLDQHDLATPTFMPPILAPLAPLEFSDDSPLMSDEAIVFAPSRIETMEPDVAADHPTDPIDGSADRIDDASVRRKWIFGGSAAAVLAIIGIAAVVFGNRGSTARAVPTPTAVVARPTAPAAVTPVPVAPAASAPAPTLVFDSSTRRTATRWLDSLKDAHPVELPRVVRVVREPVPAQPTGQPVDQPAVRTAPAASPRPTPAEDPFFIPGSSTIRRDPVVRRPATTRPDTMPTPPR